MKEFLVKKCKAYMRYHDFNGEGIPILFIHGLGCAGSFEYPEVIGTSHLKHRRCIVPDLLGAGYSDKPVDFEYTVTAHAEYLKDFITELGIKKLIIFGHSLGGAVAIELASLCGSIAAQLILSESNLDASKKGAVSYSIARYSEKDFISGGFEKLIHKSKSAGNTLWAASLSHWLPIAAYRLSKHAAAGGTPSWRTVLYGLQIPKSFIFGEYSLPDDNYAVLNEKGFHMETVERAGHAMAWENPIGLAAAIAACITV